MKESLLVTSKENNNKHQNALKELYKSHGVGQKISEKFAFWESQHPDGYSISHITSKKGKVMVFEAVWISDNFPQDVRHF